MDYKKIITSRKLRMKILRLLSFIPDKTMLKLQYKIKTGRKLDLKNPRRFTEKLQWYKLYYKNPLMIPCVDKYDVRRYVESKGLGNILVKCYGVYTSFDDIDFDEIPNAFVIKDTLGGGGNAVIIVKDKKTADWDQIAKQCKGWLSEKPHRKDAGREWPYYSGKRHRIIIEEYIDSDPSQGGLIDYKFFCFYGKAEYLYVIAGREVGTSAELGIFDSEFNLLPVFRCDERKLTQAIIKPENFSDMKSIAEKLAMDFPEARIDLYNQDNKILFGEVTFYDGSGYMKFDPDVFDFTFGEKFTLRKNNERV